MARDKNREAGDHAVPFGGHLILDIDPSLGGEVADLFEEALQAIGPINVSVVYRIMKFVARSNDRF
jgi:hypothetical protein